MILKCERAELLEAVKISFGAVPSSTPVESLKCLLLEAVGDKLHITGYNLKTAIKTHTDADVCEYGRILLNAKLFKEMVERLPEGFVTISCNNSVVTVQCGKTMYSLTGMDAAEFPELPQADFEEMFDMDPKELAEILNRTMYAVSTDEARPIYTGELFNIRNGDIDIVATDGHCLAQCRGHIAKVAGERDFVVPAEALKSVKSVCGAADIIYVADCDKHVIFQTESTDIITRKLEGAFLNVEKVFPKTFAQTVLVSRAEALRSVERVSILEDAGGKRSIYLTFGDGIVTCANNTSVGSATDSFECKGDGASNRIRFNSRLLIPALKSVPGDELKIQFNSMNSPVVISTDSNEGFRCLLMPVRQNREVE